MVLTLIELPSILNSSLSLQKRLFGKYADQKNRRMSAAMFEESISSQESSLLKRVFAGTGSEGFAGDNGEANSAQIRSNQLWVDPNGFVYLSDHYNHRIRVINSMGIISTFGGTGSESISGNSNSIQSAEFYYPYSIIGDQGGNYLFLSDCWYIWRYSFASNNVEVFGGTSTKGFAGDGGPAVMAQLNQPRGIWLTTSGNLYIADQSNHRVRKISKNIITTVVGSGSPGDYGGFSGDGGPATSAKLDNPVSVYVDSIGKLFVADLGNNRIRMVELSGTIYTFAGNGGLEYAGENIPASSASFNGPIDVKGDILGNVYIADYSNCRIHKVAVNGIIKTMIGSGHCSYSSGISPASSDIWFPKAIWVLDENNIYVSQYSVVHRTFTTTLLPSFFPTTASSGAGGTSIPIVLSTTSSSNELSGLVVFVYVVVPIIASILLAFITKWLCSKRNRRIYGEN